MNRSAYNPQRPQRYRSTNISLIQIAVSMIFMIGVNIFVYWMLTADHRADIAAYQQLANEGVKTEALIVDFWKEPQKFFFLDPSADILYYARLRFNAVRENKPASVYVDARVREATYNTLARGESIAIIYALSDPGVVAILSEYQQPLPPNVSLTLIFLNLIPLMVIITAILQILRARLPSPRRTVL